MAIAAVLGVLVSASTARANDFVRHFGGPGSGNGQFTSPLGVAVDPSSGDLYVSDSSANRVEKFDSSGNFMFSFGSVGSGPGQFNTPRGVAVDPSTGEVYVSDLNNNRVEKFDANGNFELQFGSSGTGAGQFNHPSMIAIDPANRDVYVTDLTNSRVEKFDPNGNFVSQFGSAGAGNGQFSSPNGVAVDPSTSDVYVTDFNNQRVEKFTSAGTFVAAFGSAGSGPGQFGGPFAVAVDPGNRDVYVTDGNRRVQKFDSAGHYLSAFGSAGSANGQFNGPSGIALDLSGNVFVADGTNARVDEFNSSETFLSQFGGIGTGNGLFSNALGPAVDAGTDELYVVDGGPANRLEKFTPSGSFESTFGTTGTGSGQFTNPDSVAVNPASGEVYVVDSGDNRVERFDSSGNFISQIGCASGACAAGTANGQFSSPSGVAIDPASGNLYVTDENNNRVEKFDHLGNFLATFGTTGTGNGQFNLPFGVAVNAADGDVYVAEFSNNRVQRFDRNGGFLGKFGTAGTGNGQFAGPRAVAVDPTSGNVFVVDGGHARVEEFGARGNYLSQLGTSGSASGQFGNPAGLALDSNTGAVYVTSNTDGRVERFAAPPSPTCADVPASTTEAFEVFISLNCTSNQGGFTPGYRISSGPSHGTITDFNPYTGFLGYTPAPGFVGTDTFSYYGSSDGSSSVPATVAVRVLAVPRCQNVTASVGENSSGGVQLNCTDDGGSALTYTIDSPPSHGALGAVGPSGAVVYTPNTGFTGVDSFTYHATNSDGVSSSQTIAQISVDPPPSCEDVSLVTPAGVSVTASLNCVDVTGAALNYAILSAPAHGTLGVLNQQKAQVTYSPAPGFSGTDSFTYEAASSNGTSNTSTVHITVNPPPACDSLSAATGEGNSVVVPLNCADSTGASVTYSVVSGPSHGSLSSIRQATGEVTYSPTAGFTGSDSFTYKATSANGTSNTATVSLTINPPPACQNVSVTTGTGRPVIVVMNCSDPSAPLGYAIDTQPAHGSLGSISQSTGQVVYTPTAGYTGTDSFTYHASSANGTSVTRTVSITVNPPPACHRVSSSGPENGAAITIQLSCTDASAAPLSYLIDGEPSNGTLGTINQATGQVPYTPDHGFSGTDTFTYHATSANGVSGLQTVTIRVHPVVTLLTPANNSQTNNSKPLFSGQGSTGIADAQTVKVSIVSGSTLSGTLVQTLQADVAPSGAWSVSPTNPLSDGVYTARAAQTYAGGLTAVSGTRTFTVDTQPPAVTLSSPADGSQTNVKTPTFAGVPGTAAGDQSSVTLKLYAGTSASGTALRTLVAPVSGGAWSIGPISSLADGTYTAQAEQTDAAGNTGFSSAHTFKVDTAAPAVTLTAPANCSQGTNTTPTFSGVAGAASGDLSAITVKVYPGIGTAGSPVQTLNTNASGAAWSVGASAPLGGGTYTTQAQQSDQAGNTRLTTANTFNVATTAVSITGPHECASTNVSTPVFSGGASNAAGDSPTVTVKIYNGFSTSGSAIQTLTTTQTGGSWSLPASAALADGVYTAQATQVLSGGTSTSPAIRFTIDTVAPAVTLTSPAAGSSTSNPEPSFSGAAGTAAGDRTAITVKIYAGSSATGTPVQTLGPTATGASWNVTPTTPLAAGTYTAQASQSDTAGNIGQSSANTFTIT